MSDEPHRRDADKSRQELLDEIYLLRDVAGEREQRAAQLQALLDEHDAARAQSDAARAAAQAQLQRVTSSRSWRLTAPLRWVSRCLGRAQHRASGAGDAPGRVSEAVATRGDGRGDAAVSALGAPTAKALEQPSPRVVEDRSDRTPRLYVDITELALRQGRTGVQRVTREILRALLNEPPEGFRVQPVCARPNGPYACVSGPPAAMFASNLAATEDAQTPIESRPPSGEGGRRPGGGPDARDLDGGRGPGVQGTLMPDVSLEPKRGDIFLGLDHAMDAVSANSAQLSAMHDTGVRLWFVCNDVLPLEHPEWFPPDVPPRFRTWIETIARVADGVACISRATESALRAQLDAMEVAREAPITLGHFGLGADPVVEGNAEATPAQAAVLDRIRQAPSFLMVGTLEPRKGHAQALAAFNQLWADGLDVTLVIAGFPGWMTEVTQRRIRHHDELGQRLFWFMDADDALLDALYRSCTALLAPSEGEGFGLPLAEAARHGLPILCRDLPVFREVVGEHARFFTGLGGDSLAAAIRAWLDDFRRGVVAGAFSMPRLDWEDSARQLLNIVRAIA